jgi:hypothetical protein
MLAILGLSWGYLGVMLAILGLSWAILGSSWPSWGYLGPSWGHLGPSWGHVGHLGAILGHLGVKLAILACHLGGFVRFHAFWWILEVNLAILGGPGQFWRDPGQFLRDVPCGLGGPVGLKSKAIRTPQGSGAGFGGLGGMGETRHENIRLRIIWMCG